MTVLPLPGKKTMRSTCELVCCQALLTLDHAMPSLKSILNPKSYLRYVRRRAREFRHRRRPNTKGIDFSPPGHYYSPLLDLHSLGPQDTSFPFDGPENWDHLDLRPAEQRAFYEDLLERFPPLPFPARKSDSHRYFTENKYFIPSDAFTLSGIIRKERPKRIVEIGSGFSTAVTLDALDAGRASALMTFIEPYPERLHSLLKDSDRANSTILAKPVQECRLEVFDQLEAQDLLFIDSSHVAKIGSDVAFLFLRVLPRLKPGVIVHVHDIFYPFSYPLAWIHQGRAWNESLFLRAFLLGNGQFQVMAFNSFAAHTFPDVFRSRFPIFLDNPGGSIWIRKVA